MSRWQAAGLHLLISAVVATLAFSLIFLVWYPPPLFKAMGGSELVLLLMGVDLVLGPLLTLIVFRSGKKSLKFDLGTIAVLQAGALLYGVVVIALARPVFIVARPDVAYVITATEIRTEELEKGNRPEFRKLSWFGPTLATVKLPETEAEFLRVNKLNFDEGRDIQQVPEFYRDWSEVAPLIIEKSAELSDLLHRKPQLSEPIQAWLAKQNRSIESVRYITLLTRTGELAVCIDAKTGEYLDLLDVDAS